MKVLGAVLILFALGLVGQTSAVSYCCRPNCGVCRKEECGNRDVCTNFFVSRPRPFTTKFGVFLMETN